MVQTEKSFPVVGDTQSENSIRNDVTGRQLHMNAAETRRDYVTPTRREREAARRLVEQGGPGDIVVLFPKPAPGKQFDFDAFEEDLRPLIRELERPAPPGRRRHDGREFPWYEWVPPE